MAVTSIRKSSSYALLALATISLIVFALFFLGGYEFDAKGNKVYGFTDLLIYWTYILGFLTILSVCLFALKGFFSKLSENAREALKSIIGPLALVALLVITYFIGDDTPMKVSAEAQRFNTSGWLKLSDMWIYSTYVLLFATIVAAIFGSIKSALNR